MAIDPYYLTASEAAGALGVTRATLYAYASRGQLRSEPVSSRSRERRYSREDVARLQGRKAARRDPASVAAQGLHWGGPVLASSITLIHNGRLYYRGRDAVALAETWSAEQVAALLWAAEESEHERLFDERHVLDRRQVAWIRGAVDEPLPQLQTALPIAATADMAAYDLRPPAVRKTGARILRLFTTLVGTADARLPVHRALQTAWSPARPKIADVIRTALVLCADHELNVSAFTARCAASAGASLYDVIAAAMATLKGFRHGGASERVRSLLAEADTPKRARAHLSAHLRHGEHIPGFGHPLYPSGDPRAAALVRLAEASGNDAECRLMRNLAGAGADVLHDLPNLDFGLAAVARSYRLPAQAPLVLFALGRTIGWIAHALEEYASGQLIRPRARYTGPAPES